MSQGSKAYKAAYYAANRDRILKRQAELRATKREGIAAYNAAWRAANKEKKKAAQGAGKQQTPTIAPNGLARMRTAAACM